MPRRLQPCAPAILVAVLALLSLAYCGKGFFLLTKSSFGAGDLYLRWVEERYVIDGRDPYDAYFISPQGIAHHLPLWTHRDESPIPAIGFPNGAAYPPWGYFTGLGLFWPPWPPVRIYFAALNAISLAVIFAWGYRLAKPHGHLAALLLALSGTAFGANATTLALGQYGILINAFLILAFWLELTRPRRPIASVGCGVGLGMALAKPIIAGPFVLPLLVRRSRWAIIACVVYVLAGSGLVWAITGANPVEMTMQWLRAAQDCSTAAKSAMDVFLALGLSSPAAIAANAIIFFGAATVLAFLWSPAPLLVQFAIASVAGRLWSYHLHYDNVMLIFLLAPLGELALRTRKITSTVIFLLVGISLWAPARACDHASFQIFQIFIWVFGLAHLLAAMPRCRDSAPASEFGR